MVVALFLVACPLVRAQSADARPDSVGETATQSRQGNAAATEGMIGRTVSLKEDSVEAGNALPSPTGVMLRSAVLPGWGQWVNGQAWKGLLVVGAEAGLAINAVLQDRRMVRSNTPEEREFYRNNKSLSIWWFAGVYFLNLLDAYIDASLRDFDTGPEISSTQQAGRVVWVGWRIRL
jgi:hypothetical protein